MPKKKYLDIRESESFGVYEISGRLIDFINRLNVYIEKYGENVIIEYKSDYYGDDPEIEISWLRKETDEERDARLKAKRKERTKAKEYLEKQKLSRYNTYLKLKKEFENGS